MNGHTEFLAAQLRPQPVRGTKPDAAGPDSRGGEPATGCPRPKAKCAAVLAAIALSGPAVTAEPHRGTDYPAPNPQANPFGANTRLQLPPPPAATSTAELPPVPLFNQSLPQGLRALLIRDHGHGLLGNAQPGTASIPVTHGKQVRIAGQSYYAEVTKTEIRLYSSARGILLWEGALIGAALLSVPVEMAQVQFVPPLSAGVSPGLTSHSSSSSPGNPAAPMIRVTGVQ